MEVQLKLILTACFAYFGLTSAQLHHQIADQIVTGQVDDESIFRENFQNLFDSIAKNNTKKSELYREILGQEVAREQAFDAMKAELQNARNRNIYKKVNSFYKKNIYKKRETNENNKDADKPTTNEYERDFEDKFIDYFGNELYEFRCWDKVRDWYFKKGFVNDDLTPVKKFCEAVHRAAGGGNVTVDRVILRSRELSFTKPEHVTRRVDVLSYAIENVTRETVDLDYWYLDEGAHGYIHEGRSPGCVYYLTLTNRTSMIYRLSKYVCGIDA